MNFRSKLYERYVSTFKKDQIEIDDERRHWAELKYLSFLSDVPCDSCILEIGCGNGWLMELLVGKGFCRVKGIDISEEQVQLAKSRGVDAEVSDVFEFLSTKENSFDVIIAIDFLEHFTKDELTRLVPLIYNSLRKRGKAVFQVPNGQGLTSGRVIYGDITHLTVFTPESLKQLLNLNGFLNFRFEETGPVVQNIKSCIRFVLWKLIRLVAMLIKKIETGITQRIWTENLICFCQKP